MINNDEQQGSNSGVAFFNAEQATQEVNKPLVGRTVANRRSGLSPCQMQIIGGLYILISVISFVLAFYANKSSEFGLSIGVGVLAVVFGCMFCAGGLEGNRENDIETPNGSTVIPH